MGLGTRVPSSIPDCLSRWSLAGVIVYAKLISPYRQLIRSKVCQLQLGFPPRFSPGTPRGLSRRGPGRPAHWSEASSGDQCGPALPTPLLTPPHACWALSAAPGSPWDSQVFRPPFTPPFPHSLSPGLSLARSCPRGYLAALQGPSASRFPTFSSRPSQSYPGEWVPWGQGDPVSLLASPLTSAWK